MSQDRSQLAPAALATGVVAISFAAIFFRLAAPTPPLVSAAFRLGIAALLLAPFVVRHSLRGEVSRRFLKHGVVAGLCYSVHFGAWVWSLDLTTVAASVTLVTATPLLLALLGLVTGVDRPDRGLWLALALALVGVTTIGGVDLGGSAAALQGDLLALVGAGAMAAYMLVVRRLGPTDVFAFTGVATAVGAATLFMVAGGTGMNLQPTQAALGYLALAALIPQLVGHSALTWSLQHVEPTRVGIATLGEPVGAALLALLLLSEVPSGLTLLGCAVTLTAVALALRARPQV